MLIRAIQLIEKIVTVDSRPSIGKVETMSFNSLRSVGIPPNYSVLSNFSRDNKTERNRDHSARQRQNERQQKYLRLSRNIKLAQEKPSFKESNPKEQQFQGTL